MKNGTLYRPGFHLSTLRRKPRSGAQKLADEKMRVRRHTISHLGECFARGCVETAIRAGAQAAAEDGSFSWGRFLVEMWAVKEGVFALAASSSSHIFPDGHHQFVSSQQIDDPAQVVPEDMQAHLRLDVL